MKVTPRDINNASEIFYFFKNCLTMSVREKQNDGLELIKLDILRLKEMHEIAKELYYKLQDDIDYEL